MLTARAGVFAGIIPRTFPTIHLTTQPPANQGKSRHTAGMTIRGDVGFISSDAAGTINTARTYWSNKATNLVSDLPSEAWMNPGNWGVLRFE